MSPVQVDVTQLALMSTTTPTPASFLNGRMTSETPTPNAVKMGATNQETSRSGREALLISSISEGNISISMTRTAKPQDDSDQTFTVAIIANNSIMQNAISDARRSRRACPPHHGTC